jgi:hypothetical protein
MRAKGYGMSSRSSACCTIQQAWQLFDCCNSLIVLPDKLLGCLPGLEMQRWNIIVPSQILHGANANYNLTGGANCKGASTCRWVWDQVFWNCELPIFSWPPACTVPHKNEMKLVLTSLLQVEWGYCLPFWIPMCRRLAKIIQNISCCFWKFSRTLIFCRIICLKFWADYHLPNYAHSQELF